MFARVLSIKSVIVFILIFASSVLNTNHAFAGSRLKQACKARCQINFVMLCDSSLPGGSSGGSCTLNCMDTYTSCDSSCSPGNTSCSNSCNNELASCSNGCSSGTAGCNDKYVSCLKGCDRMMQCSQDAHCEGNQVCETGTGGPVQCVARCTKTDQCRRRLGSDTICSQGHCLRI